MSYIPQKGWLLKLSMLNKKEEATLDCSTQNTIPIEVHSRVPERLSTTAEQKNVGMCFWVTGYMYL